MAEDVVIGVAIFLAFLALAWAGRQLKFSHADIWAPAN